jgi:hypothetical protein
VVRCEYELLPQLIPQDTCGIIGGDMNVDLTKSHPKLPENWRILSVNNVTQQSGGELDYALLYDPTSAYPTSSASVLEQFKQGNNRSDHSVMMYDIPLP